MVTVKTMAATVFLASGLLWATFALAYTGTITDNFNTTNLNSGLWCDISTPALKTAIFGVS
jgi:hypothetical protein